MPQPTFVPADVTTFARVDELGLRVTGQRVQAGRAVLACHVVELDDWCRRCGCVGIGAVNAHVWRQDTSAAAELRAKISRGALVWALQAIVVGHMSMARVAAGLGISWTPRKRYAPHREYCDFG